ncbi:hypothetical protein [Telluribacter sp.]|jgi:hypothetical protein|uniref:hypothetical protein n=1 Tax=Telluribacter sp. TaxID=1978767 RepID=UPI002E14A5A6|nr:hypothetical protein [Telluribacter sp.]
MAFGVKYIATYRTVIDEEKEIRFSKEGYEGEVIEWNTGSTPVSYEKGDSDMLFEKPIVSSIVTIQLNVPYQLNVTEFLSDRQEWRVEIVSRGSGVTDFSGWVEPYNGHKPYNKPPHEVTLTASCGLSHLRKIRYKPTITSTTTKSAIAILHECLLLTGHDFPILATVLTRENSLEPSERVLDEVGFDTDRYYNGEQQRLYAYDVLEDILNHFNAELFQYNQEWRIRSLSDLAQGASAYIAYVNGVYSHTPLLNPPMVYQVNGAAPVALSMDGGVIGVLPPVKRYKAVANLAPYANMMPNGELRHTSAGAFVGWTNVGEVPSGVQISSNPALLPNFLRLDGSIKFSDVVYEFKHTLSNKTTYTYLYQPTKYFKSPPVFFGRYTKKLTIKGSYSTSAPIDGDFIEVIMGIRATTADGTQERWLDVEGVWRKEWRCVKFPPSVLTSSRDGVSTEPGTIEVEVDTGILNIAHNIRQLQTLGITPPLYTNLEIRLYQVLNKVARGSGPFVKWYGFRAQPVREAEDNEYELTLQTESVLEDEGESVELMTADYLPGFTGTMVLTDTGAPTSSWKRHNRTEANGIMWLMLADRLAMLHQPMKMVECDIVVKSGFNPSFLNLLRFADQGEGTDLYKVTRWEWTDHLRRARVTAVELRYLETTLTKVTKVRDSTRPSRNGRILIDEEGGGGVVLPSEEPDAGSVPSGRMGVEEVETLEAATLITQYPWFEGLPTLDLREDSLFRETIDLTSYLATTNPPELIITIEDILDKPDWCTVTTNGLVVTISSRSRVLNELRLPKLLLFGTIGNVQRYHILSFPTDIFRRGLSERETEIRMFPHLMTPAEKMLIRRFGWPRD